MIFLIDDKKLRQEKDFDWTSERLKCHSDFLTPVYTLEELERRAEEIFSDDNIVLYHESFLDNSTLIKQTAYKRNKLEEYAQKHKSFNLVIFSGSKNSRSIRKNVAHLPVSIVYQNLSVFVEKCSDNIINLNYLAYGNNPEIELQLVEKLEESLAKIEKLPAQIQDQSCLFISTFEKDIRNPIENATIVTLFNEESDKEITDFIHSKLSDRIFDNVFLPLCYGDSLSDYSGLRLATHIRCTPNANQLSRIFIYGFVGADFLLHNEYINILKSKNVFLVPFAKQSFRDYATTPFDPLTFEELPRQVAKLKLELPMNYEDNHSIANEWAIYRWAGCLGVDLNDELQVVFNEVNSNLYFKYLKTINPITPTDVISSEKLQIERHRNPKTLLIDDEADKGWNEVLAYLLADLNGIYSDYLGDGFKNRSSEEIIVESIKKIKDDEIDIVILDFRLNSDDFECKNPAEISSIKLLNEIKILNPGIQVIVFSATNKVWNMQMLQEAGAYDFVIKESPENNSDGFTKSSIIHFIKTFEECIKLNFLKDFFKCYYEVEAELLPRRDHRHDRPLPKEFVDEALKWLSLSNEILNKGKINDSKIVSSFLFKFSVLENLSNRIIDVDNPIPAGKDQNGTNKYQFQFRISEEWLKDFSEEKDNIGFYRKTKKIFKSSRNLPWVIKILNAMDFIANEKLSTEKLSSAIKKRNDFIHANSTTGDKAEVTIEDLVFLNKIITTGLKNIV